MAYYVTTGSMISLIALYFLSNSVASSATTGYQGDALTRERRFSLLAHHQHLSGDEGKEADYDSLSRKKRDSTINGGSDAKFSGGRGVVDEKWVDSVGDMNNSGFLIEDDNGQQSPKSSDELAKRKWSENNVRIWGKRKWSSKGLHLWGKRQEGASHGVARRPMAEEDRESLARDGEWPSFDWQHNRGSDGENDGNSMKKRQKWAKNNLKIWGKRNTETDLNADDLEEMREKGAGSTDAEEEDPEQGLQGTGFYGNRVSGYLHKRNNSPSYGIEQKWGKKGWANNNVRIWG